MSQCTTLLSQDWTLIEWNWNYKAKQPVYTNTTCTNSKYVHIRICSLRKWIHHVEQKKTHTQTHWIV